MCHSASVGGRIRLLKVGAFWESEAKLFVEWSVGIVSLGRDEDTGRRGLKAVQQDVRSALGPFYHCVHEHRVKLGSTVVNVSPATFS